VTVRAVAFFRLGEMSASARSSFCERALVLVANRLTAPTSEHGLARASLD
jgi:hypothetical protein